MPSITTSLEPNLKIRGSGTLGAVPPMLLCYETKESRNNNLFVSEQDLRFIELPAWATIVVTAESSSSAKDSPISAVTGTLVGNTIITWDSEAPSRLEGDSGSWRVSEPAGKWPRGITWISQVEKIQDAPTPSGTFNFNALVTRQLDDILNFTGLDMAQSPVAMLETKNPRLAERLEELISLEADWDGAGAVQTTTAALKRAVGLLLRAEHIAVSARFIAPLADGGLQLEWGPGAKGKLVVAIDPTGDGLEFVYIDDGGAINAIEGWLDRDFDLDHYLSILS